MRRGRAIQQACEPLERRVLLSVLSWTNRGSDGFDTHFGSDAATARNIVDRALTDWGAAVVNFNYADGGNTFSLTINADAMAAGLRAESDTTDVDASGKPTAATITIDDDAGGGGWYFDSIIGTTGAPDDSEFVAVRGPFSANAASNSGNDFYRTVLHEIGHAVGISVQWSTLAINSWLTDTATADPNAPAGSASNLWRFSRNGVVAGFTQSGGLHFYEGPAIDGVDLPIHPENVLNPGRTVANGETRRQLIDDLTLNVLREAYGYTVNTLGLNNMFVNRNTTSNRVNVRGLPGGDTVTIQQGGTGINFFVNGYLEVVPLAGISEVVITTDAGDDSINIHPVLGNRPVTVSGGSGNDSLVINDTSFSSGRVANIYASQVQIDGVGLINYNGFEALAFHGGSGADSIRVASLSIPLTVNGNAGNDILRPGFNEATMQHSLANINADITFNGGAGVDSMILRNEASSNNWFHDIHNGYVESFGPSLLRRVNIPGVERVEIAGGSGNDLMTTHSGANYEIVFRGNSGNDIFDMRGGGAATLFGGNGDDRFVFGGGNLGPSISNVVAFGDAGHDTMVLDDRNSTHSLPWAVYGNTGNANTANTVFLGLNAYGYSGFEGIEIRGGNGNNEFQMHSTTAALHIHGGGGNDTFRLENFYNQYEQGLAIITHTVSLDGGTGTDSIIVNDQPRNTTTYTLEPERLAANEILTPLDFDITYANINSMTINASNAVSNLNVLGTPASITSQITFFGNGGNDNISITPRDGQGNLTINGTLGVFGGSGTDTLTINGTTSSIPLDLSFVNLSGAGTANITGMGDGGFGAFSDIENIIVNGGSGNDVVAVESFTTGNALTINGGAGDDTLFFGNANLPANVTSMAAFEYNGGDGNDTFHLRNQNSSGDWGYTQLTNLAGQHYVSASGPSYGVTLYVYGSEHVRVDAGSGNDTFTVHTVPLGSRTTFNAGAGADLLQVGGSFPLGDLRTNIRGPVFFDGQAGGGRLIVTDPANSTGRTVLQTTSLIGAHADDTLFGDGAYIQFANLADSGGNPGLTLNLGSGPDAIYATPLADARMTVNANNPTSAPGDTLHLLLAGVQDHAINSTGVGAGNVTSSNRQTLNWTGIESGPFVIIEAPTVHSSSFEVNTPQQQLRLQFSANVSGSLTTSSMTLMNLTTSQPIPPASMALAYDAATNTATFTFPGYTHGVLPDGNYRLTLPAGAVSDPNGNPNQAEHTLEFFFLQGDANRDGVVNLQDFNILAMNFGQSPRTFSQGDFNYDGAVNLQDFNILASRFGTVLGAAGPSGRAPAPPFGSASTDATWRADSSVEDDDAIPLA